MDYSCFFSVDSFSFNRSFSSESSIYLPFLQSLILALFIRKESRKIFFDSRKVCNKIFIGHRSLFLEFFWSLFKYYIKRLQVIRKTVKCPSLWFTLVYGTFALKCLIMVYSEILAILVHLYRRPWYNYYIILLSKANESIYILNILNIVVCNKVFFVF